MHGPQPNPQFIYNFDPQDVPTPPPAPPPPTMGGGGDGSQSSVVFLSPNPSINLVYRYDSDVPAGFLAGNTCQDEDFWQNSVVPAAASIWQRLPLGDPEELPAGFLRGQSDEDFWQNPVPPIASSIWQTLPILWDDDPTAVQIVTTLGPDEDFWVNPVLPVQANFYQSLPYAFADRDEIPGGLVTPFGFGSGDGSQSSQIFISGSANPLVRYNFDPQDFPSGAVSTFQADEDFWINPVVPVIPEPTLLFIGDEWAGNPNFDEDFWKNLVSPVVASNTVPVQWAFETDEFVPPPIFAGTADEDYWVNAVPSLWPTLRVPQQWEFEQNESAGSLYGQPDEDFWVNGVAPVWQYAIAPQQWLYETNDPAGALAPQLDEDFWVNAVAPLSLSLYQRLPLVDDSDLTVTFTPPPPVTSDWLSPKAHMRVSK